jgi:hypothetical protein
MDRELGSDFRVVRSEVINHPEYSKPVLKVQSGWRHGKDTVWDEVKIEELNNGQFKHNIKHQ